MNKIRPVVEGVQNGNEIHETQPVPQQQQQRSNDPVAAVATTATTTVVVPVNADQKMSVQLPEDNGNGGERLVEVEVEGGLKSKEPTPFNTETTSYLKRVGSSQQPQSTIYGRPIPVSDSGGSFPNAGSVLGPYFCLGQLGKGTFSSIHKCINMQYYHHDPFHNTNNNTKNNNKASPLPLDADESSSKGTTAATSSSRRRIAAAKVELGSFQQSGVLEAEATVLDFLHRHVPSGTVPVYMGHFRSEKFAAILMEYLPGEDMHQLRERVMAQQQQQQQVHQQQSLQPHSAVEEKSPTRRLSTADAVYFTADVMLPLLQRMHQVGVVHRDVKPSNCVRKGDGADRDGSACSGRDFCMVDFGLSKSIVVPEDSEFADKEHYWDEAKEWLKPLNYHQDRKACYRKERVNAEFRGTSMYASLRVHQGKDYCPRDDMWSLLYVFCDLVSGGLPWMSLAANRDRAACQKVKEWVHGEDTGGVNHTDELLKGDIYHVAKYRRERQKEAKVEAAKLSPVPEPLEMCKEETKVLRLRQAFQHIAQLRFWETPNYDLIQTCIRSFNHGTNPEDPTVVQIDWGQRKPRPTSPDPHKRNSTVQWDLVDGEDPFEVGFFNEAEQAAKAHRSPDDFWSRLPIERRYQLAQMDCNLEAADSACVPPHRALRDWMKVVLPLLYEDWDSRKYEDGGHRTATDGYKRTRYLELLKKCDVYAKKFHNFQAREFFYEEDSSVKTALRDVVSLAEDVASESKMRLCKRRKVLIQHCSESSTTSDLVFVSRALVGLQLAIKAETGKKAPPPVRISFG